MFKKMVWCLAWFHTIIIERKKFMSLGWDVPYDFNDSDFNICKDIIANYIHLAFMKGSDTGDKKDKGDKAAKKNKEIQWNAITYLIGDANYGGRVTAPNDRRLLTTYTKKFFDELIFDDEEPFYLAHEDLPKYRVPDYEKEGKDKGTSSKELKYDNKEWYIARIEEFDDDDPPKAFGQHINAAISSQIQATHILLNSVLSLQPKNVSTGNA